MLKFLIIVFIVLGAMCLYTGIKGIVATAKGTLSKEKQKVAKDTFVTGGMMLLAALFLLAYQDDKAHHKITPEESAIEMGHLMCGKSSDPSCFEDKVRQQLTMQRSLQSTIDYADESSCYSNFKVDRGCVADLKRARAIADEER